MQQTKIDLQINFQNLNKVVFDSLLLFMKKLLKLIKNFLLIYTMLQGGYLKHLKRDLIRLMAINRTFIRNGCINCNPVFQKDCARHLTFSGPQNQSSA